jgi:hypothetical protein
MNGKIDLFSLAFGAEKNNSLTNTHTIKNLLYRANKNYSYGGKNNERRIYFIDI